MTIKILQLVYELKNFIDNIVLMFSDDDLEVLQKDVKTILDKIEDIEKTLEVEEC